LKHKGFALIDVLSPCVTFNDHEGSTKSYQYTREHYDAAVHADFVPFQREIAANYAAGDVLPVVLHDGSRILLRKLDEGYDPTNREAATSAISERLKKGEFLTGLLYVDPEGKEFHDVNETPSIPLNQIPFKDLSPGSAALAKVLARYR
jgi:2-oxoglutarate ferredoxin oxidoreductase subunit beta